MLGRLGARLPGSPFPTMIVVGLALACFVVLLALLGFASLSKTRWGRGALLVGLALLPVSISAAGLGAGVHESSRTRFCLQCHEMQDYGKCLFVDERASLPAHHYQNRLIDRDTICFSCHTDYAMFGDLKAKLNGLRHVWVHYLRPIPKKIALYQTYSNRNCLHCHEDARAFVEAPPHRGIEAQLASGATSCLTCHRIVHDKEKVQTGPFWGAE